ncbi:hypothetical protein CCR75_002012 [Bremia lactucae]|uniref:Secreted protein n=1 Tax=Bremia lactucae TaxID=4779 RepID=A0A976FHT0_BRELC|nr:hypothetical protein CCR75_002012 [Bremia lactucae]
MMPFFTSTIIIAIAAAAVSSAHRIHHTRVMRGLQTDTSINHSSMDMITSEMSNSTMDMQSSAINNNLSDDDYRCPVCGMSTMNMGYNNLNHVGFVNGQIIYTCGMAARSFGDYGFDLTDTAYLAANIAEFIVNPSDATNYAECRSSCDECTNGIKDPLTGDNVNTSNYQYVCLSNGQKIYFASAANRVKYLNNVKLEPRYLVNNTICQNTACADGESITALSAAAQAFVPETTSTNSSDSLGETGGTNAVIAVKAPMHTVFALTCVLTAISCMT